MPLNTLFLNLAVILMIAGVTTVLFKWLKQPLVLGYILAGFITGPHLFMGDYILDNATISLWGEIGVVFLLFGLGLEFSFKKIKKVGGAGSVAAVIEALLMMSTGIIVGHLMGWGATESVFLGGMISISSTSIVIKAFEDLRMKSMKFTQIVFGVLVIEDIIAVLLLVLLTTRAISKQFDGIEMLYELSKLLVFIFLWFTFGIYLIPSLIHRIRKLLTDEIILILTVGLCFGMVVIAAYSGFSAALGAFLMGTIMSETEEQERILRLIAPLKNLFAAVFFISVGMLVDPAVLVQYWGSILLISIVVLFIKPITATIGILFSGQPLKLAMQAGLSLSQIGEFSFIIASLGLSLKVLNPNVYPIIVTVSIITCFLSPYMMRMAVPLYDKLFKSVPNSWQVAISQYGSGKQILNHESDWKKILKSYILRISANSIWLSAILFISINMLKPYVFSIWGEGWVVKVGILLISLTMMSPFIFALTARSTEISAFNRLWADQKYARGPLLTLMLIRFLISAVFIGILLASMFQIQYFILFPAVAFILGFVILSRFIKRYYRQMQNRFLNNLDKTKKLSKVIIPHSLANEIHIEIMYVSNDSIVLGKTISDIHRKYRTGVQIITIYRFNKKIELPNKNESMQSGDKLLVIGNDDQLMNFRTCIETEGVPLSTAYSGDTDLELYQVTLSEHSKLIGRKAHVSGLRDEFNFLLVGYQSNSTQFHRPNPTHCFVLGDTVWAVGHKDVVNSLI